MFIFCFIFPLITLLPVATNSFGDVDSHIDLPFCEVGINGDQYGIWWSLFAASFWEILFSLVTIGLYLEIFWRLLKFGVAPSIRASNVYKLLIQPQVMLFCWLPEFLWLYSKQYGFDAQIPVNVQDTSYFLWLSAGLLYFGAFSFQREGLIRFEDWAAVSSPPPTLSFPMPPCYCSVRTVSKLHTVYIKFLSFNRRSIQTMYRMTTQIVSQGNICV